MDIKCKNCGQMIDENDKYCKYCGYLIPQKEEEIPLSKVAIEDKIQESKAIIADVEIAVSKDWDFAKLKVLKRGDKKSLTSKGLGMTFLMIALSIAFLAAAILSKFLIPNDIAAFVCLLIFMLAMISTFGFTLERYYNTKGLANLKDNEITIKKYGFKKPAEVLIDGNVFEVVIDSPCPVCEGDIIGDLHIEKIEKNIVVVCNINRKHIFKIEERQFIDALRNGHIELIDNKKK